MLSREQDHPKRSEAWEFLEVWIGPPIDSPVMLVLVSRVSGKVEILDPADAYESRYTSDSYEDAALWLAEDEFRLVRGRVQPEDV